MWRPCGAQRAQHPDFAAAQSEPVEDRFLPSCEEWPDPGQASRHLEVSHADVGPGALPFREQSVGVVIGHLSMVIQFVLL